MSVMVKQFFFVAVFVSSALAQPDRFGTPACDFPSQLARRTAFVLCFNPETKVADWTIYELKPENIDAPSTPRPTHFRRDPELGSASDADYRGSYFQRGHLVPAADLRSSPEALAESFLLSNAAPQLPRVNQSAMRRIENSIRRMALSQNEPIYVVTGTLYDCGTEIHHIGRSQVAVPCGFYKATLSSQGVQVTIVSNETNPYLEAVPVEKLEKRTGVLFSRPLAACGAPANRQAFRGHAR